MTDALELIDRVLDQTAVVLAGVGDKHRDLPTPCRSWTVDVLERHLIDDVAQFRTSALGGKADFGKPVPDVEGDRVAAFRAGAAELLEVWRAKDSDAVIELPMGTVPISFLMTQQLTEFCVHSWDLATATGQDAAALDPELAEAALAWARGVMQPSFRGSEDDGKVFGPEQSVREDAAAYERLAAFYGRVVDA